MLQGINSITYLPLPDSLQATIEQAINAISGKVISHSEPYASKFDLPSNDEVKLVVEEAKKAYQKEKLPRDFSVLSLHGAVFRGRWKSGGLNDTVIVPLIDHHAEVIARNESGDEKRLDWNWKNAIFVQRLTFFEIEGENKIGAIILQFRR
ncbi:hypothetical protein TRV_01190 [Trichophyton verrucosum HKI 0517]|uniref:Uncharacterized protein n=1 Tax=Trichophyton verrucosum (strain HKI 0517) TaxID=663202 RepID=D4D287_TRIVH|nr:uncharacterized protein TRV_01190 [Trichophyton verrucosum HKI 0517]EFE44010.1 hypothetical protein TRV_01190 [Trichophyton verrucosum HKI 0517]